MVKTDGEAIAVLQEQMNSVKKDVSTLQSDVKDIKIDTTKILENLIALPQNYLTLNSFEQFKKDIHDDIKRAGRRTWIQNTLSAALGIIFGAVCAAVFYSLFVKGAR